MELVAYSMGGVAAAAISLLTPDGPAGIPGEQDTSHSRSCPSRRSWPG